VLFYFIDRRGDADPFSDPVDLGDIVAAAERLRMETDKDWS